MLGVHLVWFNEINRSSLRAMTTKHRKNSLPVMARFGLCSGRSLWRASSLGTMFCVSVLLVSIGCVQRRMTVRSNPPGALVYVDDYQIGTTPVSTDFVYYGTRKIRLIKDGYDTLTVQQPFPVPWYEIFPLDFVTENLWPWEIRDERVVDLAMVPAGTVPAEAVVSRAELARRSAGSGPPVPVAPVAVPVPSLSPGTSPVSPNVLPQAPVGSLPQPTTSPVFPLPQ